MAMAWTTVPAPAPIGALTVGVSTDGAVAHVGFGDVPGRVAGAARRLGEDLVADPERTAPVVAQLTEYLAGTRRVFDLDIDWRGTGGTRRTVLQTLYTSVGYGETISYGELAVRSGAFADGWTGSRGVGSIMGSNPVPVIVPCHRVLAAAGPGRLALGGFGGGRAAKEWLLALEGVLTPALDLGW
ncbi:methylated-DNA--[protein]-cysteine S-methyltransferase [Pseudonocardia hispaniensis]|uniref:Methylated-DNA--protein-cysteine methyltransferase n=1 Tax=Pseudonocardia hispaniensis TaxID=904933 RepID=A0ABW1J6L9_9PSEU